MPDGTISTSEVWKRFRVDNRPTYLAGSGGTRSPIGSAGRELRLAVGAARDRVPSRAGRILGLDRRERRREVDAAEDPDTGHVPDRRTGSRSEGRVGALIEVRAGIYAAPHRPREHLPDRHADGPEAQGDRESLRRDRRVRRPRERRRPPGEVLLVAACRCDSASPSPRTSSRTSSSSTRSWPSATRRFSSAASSGCVRSSTRARRSCSSRTISPRSRRRVRTPSGSTTARCGRCGPDPRRTRRVPRRRSRGWRPGAGGRGLLRLRDLEIGSDAVAGVQTGGPLDLSFVLESDEEYRAWVYLGISEGAATPIFLFNPGRETFLEPGATAVAVHRLERAAASRPLLPLGGRVSEVDERPGAPCLAAACTVQHLRARARRSATSHREAVAGSRRLDVVDRPRGRMTRASHVDPAIDVDLSARHVVGFQDERHSVGDLIGPAEST